MVCLAGVLQRISDLERLKPLTDEQISELKNWDAEKFRQALNK